ncbi:MAG: ParB/RepB/Spo0J family partition protein [Bacteroidales bacterium]|nr:ParB/RepB/Spo0J family partition protein [Bacteroidales bacterium]
MNATNPQKRKALGRGLGALLDVDESITSLAFPFIDIDLIIANPYQPRNTFEEEKLKELAESIKSFGIIQPLTVRKMPDGTYQLISGERRLKAAKMVGLKTIPVFIRDASETDLLQMALIENIQREDLNAIDIALSFEKLIEEYHLTQEQLSEKIGKNRSTIANYLRLLKLPIEVQAAIKEGKISMGHARAIITLPNENLQLEITQKILEKGLSVRQVEEWVRKIQQSSSSKKKTTHQPKHPYLDELQQKFQQKGFKVKIVQKKKSGSIIIHFRNEEELLSLIHFFENVS